jgi:type III pantothenate kinase
MNLVLDFGNTRIKAGVFNEANLVEKRIFDSEDELIDSILTLLPIKHCMVCSVAGNHEKVYEEFSAKFDTHLFTAATKLPFTNRYRSALTLGSDRVAASAGAFNFYPNKNVLTIDAGTCIKYNFVNSVNEYLGGGISPGIQMRLKAMHNQTHALPLVESDKLYSQLIGTSTSESILTGAMVGAACEVDEMINRYKSKFKDLQVIITGGDGDYLSSQLKNTFFANQNILLYGLNAILNFNLEK